MTTKKQYKVEISKVIVTFTSGEVKEYLITATPSIGGYLAREAGESGILSLWNGERSFAIPLVQIQEWEIAPYAEVAPEEGVKG